MPLTPFIGLSVLIHALVIMSYSALSRIMNFDRGNKINSAAINLTISLTIILLVFVFTAINAVILVHASIADNHSSIKFVERHIGSVITFNLVKGSLDSESEFFAAGISSCNHQRLDKMSEKYKGSLVDYLKSKDMDSSFKARKELAYSFDMENYQGAMSENSALLRILLESEAAHYGC